MKGSQRDIAYFLVTLKQDYVPKEETHSSSHKYPVELVLLLQPDLVQCDHKVTLANVGKP